MDEGKREDRTYTSVHSSNLERNAEARSIVNADHAITAIAPDLVPKSEFERTKRELLKDPYFCSWSEKQVSNFLLKRLDDLSRHHQIPYRSSEISFSRGIWGSCSTMGHIIINFNVAILSEHLRDYVFLHELVHTKVRGHNDDFWRELDKYTDGKSRKLRNELCQYHMKVTYRASTAMQP